MSTPRVYAICDTNCRWESMTREQILSAITQAVSTGTISDVDDGFVTKIKESNHDSQFQIWVGTQAEYNAITPAEGVLYVISDDNFKEDIITDIEQLQTEAAAMVESVNGMSEDILTLQNNISDLQTAQTTIDGDIGDLETDVAALQDLMNEPRPVLWSGNTELVNNTSVTMSSDLTGFEQIVIEITVDGQVTATPVSAELAQREFLSSNGFIIEAYATLGYYTQYRLFLCGVSGSTFTVKTCSNSYGDDTTARTYNLTKIYAIV